MRKWSSRLVVGLAAILYTACSTDEPNAAPPGALAACVADADCQSGLVCSKNVCVSKTATNGTKDGSESDVDCGGLEAPPCELDATCTRAEDCKDKVCIDGKCAAGSATDNIKNGSETDVDCGGGEGGAPRCAEAKTCKAGTDCASGVCEGGTCKGGGPNDNIQNGNETDVDCGGGDPAPGCAPGKKCSDGARDCASKVCTGGICQEPKADDTVKNGDESDVDCGGTTTNAPRCVTGKTCTVHEDCASQGCAFDKKCAAGRSCTQQMGGVTCGTGEVGEAGAQHESCCLRGTIAGSTTQMDKYHVTAGRMRAMVERLNGDVRTFAKTTAGWNTAWDALVPSTMAEADIQLGSYWNGAANDPSGAQSKRSCAPGSFGGHTYFTPANGDDFSDFTKDELDVKALNCIGWHLARAFCSWEGGRLPTEAEINRTWKNNNTTTYPWGNQYGGPDTADPRLNHQFNYGFPNKAGRRLLGGGAAADIAWHVSPPGRYPLGRNQAGIEIAGDLLHWISDNEYDWSYTFSWERHEGNLSTNNWKARWPEEPNGYYAIGFRCVY